MVSTPPQDFRLTWVNYSQKLTEAFNKFLTTESLCNVTLSVNRKSIKAHQAILSACSPWFEQLLIENQHPHPIIIMKDVRYENLRNILRFIYTGEVSVPQNELQDFLRTAELLEIKGLLKTGDEASQSISTLVYASNASITAPAPALSVPVSSVLLTDNSSHINDLVSQIKVPVSLVPSTSASPPIANASNNDNMSLSGNPLIRGYIETKRRKPVEKRPLFTATSSGEAKRRNSGRGGQPFDPTHVVINDEESPLLPQAAVEEDAVSWVSAEEVRGRQLTPAEIVKNGVSDCGAFKRVWAERYLCYNLGREIICLLCFCRFTQFKKFNLERHMRNKHTQLYNLSETHRKHILERYVKRYEEHVTPGMVASVPSHGNENMAAEIMSVGPIQLEDLNLDIELGMSLFRV